MQHPAYITALFSSYFSQHKFTFQAHISKSFYWLLSVYNTLSVSLFCPVGLSSGILYQQAFLAPLWD